MSTVMSWRPVGWGSNWRVHQMQPTSALSCR